MARMRTEGKSSAAEQAATTTALATQLGSQVASMIAVFAATVNERTQADSLAMSTRCEEIATDLSASHQASTQIAEVCHKSMCALHNKIGKQMREISALPTNLSSATVQSMSSATTAIDSLKQSGVASLTGTSEALEGDSARLKQQLNNFSVDAMALKHLVADGCSTGDNLRKDVQIRISEEVASSHAAGQQHFREVKSISKDSNDCARAESAKQKEELSVISRAVVSFTEGEDGFRTYKTQGLTPRKDDRPLPQSPQPGQVWKERMVLLERRKFDKPELDVESHNRAFVEQQDSLEKQQPGTKRRRLRYDGKGSSCQDKENDVTA
jgi:hypothetical protein